ncbi:LEAF RUST 10 DISEASE-RESISTANCEUS RECEPTOR-LIKE PROTEIN KINASE-like 2.1 isoform X1 [Triticum aestivum]|uniref:Protein kinase domain-containing protein n=1 Tax=Triticum aestivum TaxID=4565 RepID=A0A3B6FPK8_WHEAT|nr:LEAF RUST 10 DISEASE-RESISTANCE LOCUS RECEPTOR-LIKE PROTEIN KINASE-like 2.1 isoform X1 [Triticum aestivum]
MARLPPHLLVLLFLAVHVFVACHGSPLPPSSAYNDSVCWESFRCGGVDIRYPFYLSNATQATPDYTSQYACGYTDLKIFCQGEGATAIPILQLGQDALHNYTVRNIIYENHAIILRDTEALISGGKCPTVAHNVTFDREWLNYTESLEELTFFFGCHSPESDHPAPLEKFEIDCKGFNPPPGSGDGVSFVFTSEEGNVSREHELVEYCRQKVIAPVLQEYALRSDPPVLLPKDYGAVLGQGFELEWKQSKDQQCDLCEKSYERCAYSEKKEFLACLCSGGYCGSSSGATAAYPNPNPPSGRQYSKKRMTIYTIAGSSMCLLFFAFWLGYKKYKSKGKSKETARIESFLQKNGTVHPKRYTYAQVKRMTRSFAEKLGQGGFGAVYRGDLSDGHQIAVKMLKDFKTDGEDFINELASISRTSHVNVVTLLGFCLEGSKRALIYDYMPNGSLERYAFKDGSQGGNTLGWEKLFEIAVGIARGLEYLHRGCNTRIVHFDIKPHNILLDQNFCPKISDFGLAKLCLNKESVISIGGARGTIGYIAPEVYSKQFGAVSSKSDVYSYGMMVLEMVGARDKNISPNTESSSQYFPQWIYEHLDEYCISASEINGEITEVVRKMIVVGLWCIQLSSADRPTMTRVVEMLEGSTTGLELPPKVLLS